MTFGVTPLWTGGKMALSRGLVLDAEVDIQALLIEAFSARISRGLDAAFVTTALAGLTSNG